MNTISRTAEQKTNHLGFPKPGELIEMTGTHALEARDRAILNLLYQNAQDSGKLLEQNAEGEIPLSTVSIRHLLRGGYASQKVPSESSVRMPEQSDSAVKAV